MKYRNIDIDALEDTGKVGVLVTNLGTADAPETAAYEMSVFFTEDDIVSR